MTSHGGCLCTRMPFRRPIISDVSVIDRWCSRCAWRSRSCARASGPRRAHRRHRPAAWRRACSATIAPCAAPGSCPRRRGQDPGAAHGAIVAEHARRQATGRCRRCTRRGPDARAHERDGHAQRLHHRSITETSLMIGRLKGILVHKQPPWLVIDVHGVGYELEAPMSTFYDMPDVGREVALFTHYAQKEDSVSLYGFLRDSERRLFRDVQKVTGIGAKIALAILSGISVDEFARTLQAGDVTALTRIPGIGKKTAERMVVELRDRAADMVGGGVTLNSAGAPADPQSEALVALQQLGYKPAEAARLARDATAEGDDTATIIR